MKRYAQRLNDSPQLYADTPLGFVDASITATAERLNIVTLLTTDRRHFSLIRPADSATFRLVP